MTWTARLKVTTTAVVLLVFIGAGTVLFNQRAAAVSSSSASIQAQQSFVGTDYSGNITRSYVGVGDEVTKGQKLFEMQSLSVLQNVPANLLPYTGDGYTVSTTGVMVFTATTAGTVSAIDSKDGAFVQTGGTLATIDEADSLHVIGDYSIDPTDYARLRTGALVDLKLPDQATIRGTVQSFTAETDHDQARTRIVVASPMLVRGSANGLVTPGTPVAASVQLHDDGMFAGAQDAMLKFVQKIGL